MTADNATIGEYLAARGAPFYELQLRLNMLQERSLHSGRRALVFVALAWGLPFLLSVIEGRAIGPFAERPYLLDIGVWARFVVAIAVFTIAEGRVEVQLRETLKQFTRAPLLSPESFEPAAKAVTQALQRRDSRTAEAICLLLAYAASMLSLINVSSEGSPSWAITVSPSGGDLTAAGWFGVLLSNPFFFFLLLRGIWRHIVWAMLLRRIAALELRLIATHPDGNGGLAFVGRYPNAFALSIFGISCVVAAGLAHQLLQETITVTAYGWVMGLWLILVMALFAYPLVAFMKPLANLKQSTLHLTSAKGTQFQRQAERKLLGINVAANDPSEAEMQEEIADPAKQLDATRKMSTMLLDRSALVPLGAAALMPLLAAGATQMPYKELWAICKKLLLL